ncbi:hypothetical protein KNT98_gp60 [Gordonia phage Frokostdame]|uniref:Uncharacterized protein n=1 Tax=Gordonia phage Frokostdame TaxID=2250320 RepID=A0A345L350_9CAUD|nr:hypothetical protein KNT98_gp60 [Gordonia phage Frokostdame]AXH49702.1 hypothetical protein SEA_FROKOSTDAME_60 [Gordonia phage Frokostdame]
MTATQPTRTVGNHLSEQQLARVDALYVARSVLSSKGFSSSGAVDPDPLMDIAHYVITGADRWAERSVRDAEQNGDAQ